MDKNTLVDRIADYFPRTREGHLNQVRQTLDRVAPADYGHLYARLIETVDPTHTIGVKTIVEACRAHNIAVLPESVTVIPSELVRCDCCSAPFRYHMGGTGVDNVHAACPGCGFPYSETVTIGLYREIGRSSMFEAGYERAKRGYMSGRQRPAENTAIDVAPTGGVF